MRLVLGSLTLALVAGTTFTAEGPCVFKGQCGTGGSLDLGVPCAIEGEATRTNTLNRTAYDQLVSLCPDFDRPNGEFCCDDSQVGLLVQQFSNMALFLKQCPSCNFNMARIFCHMTCSPRQTDFIEVTAKENATEKSPYGTKKVGRISYYLSEDYIDRTYASCAEVRNPQTGLALKMFCGSYTCSPKNLLLAVGTGGFSPFPMEFEYTAPEGHVLFDHNTTKCSQAPFPGESPCACADCVDVCPPYVVPDDEVPFRIFGQDGYFVLTISLLSVVLAGLALFWICKYSLGFCDALDRDETNLLSSESLQVGAKAPSAMRRGFERLGFLCASRPWTTIAVGAIFCSLFSLGNLNFQVVTDPVQLWSAPTSEARTQREYYGNNLAPFYRIEQVIIVNKGGKPFVYESNRTQQSYEFSPVFRSDFLADLLDLQEKITNLKGTYNNGTANEEVDLQSICFSPLDKKCAIQSVPNWFQNNISIIRENPEKYLDHIVDCVNSPTLVPGQDDLLNIGCLGEYGGPSFYYAALGGYDEDKPLLAPAVVLTFLVNNHAKAEDNERAVAWEQEFIRFMKNFTHPNMTVAFMGESSITSELDVESRSDVSTIAVSYLLMFLYVAVVLGRYKSVATVLLHSQIVLGAMGVFLVLVSVVSSVGIYSLMGIPSTLIIFEVVPFLVLAIGVDNIFILVQAYQRSSRLDGESLEEHVARIVGLVGPSLLLASASEVTCFFLGALTSMPAVRTFALYAALALLIDVLLQITVFVSMLTLDIRRQESGRFDLLCCMKSNSDDTEAFEDSTLFNFMKNVYSPLLRKDYYRFAILVTFLCYLGFSLSVIPHLDVGLDQEISMPRDSYLQDYFRSLKEYLRVGPPAYFVIHDKYNYSDANNQNLIGTFEGAANDSLVNQLIQASRTKEKTFIAAPAMSWIDDYFAWSQECCFENNKTHERCPAENISHGCLKCTGDSDRPPSMTSHIKDFLHDIPDVKCGKGGHAAYSQAIQLVPNAKNLGGVEIGATSFMTYHSILKNSTDFINALRMGRYVAEKIEKRLKESYKGNKDDAEVFPYSIFYVFYEQYLTIWSDVAKHLLISFTGVLLITFLLMKFKVFPTIAIGLTISMIVSDLMGVMYMANVSLNAISLVNLVMCVGISVEFCSHIVKAFIEDDESCPIERAINAVAHTGSSVLSGITFTKFIGVVVLFFAKSQLFVIFYFRMYLAIVLLGSFHGLVFLPVFLATFGSPKSTGRNSN
ncbi:NPC intracellular cholesterol transporter 1 [Galendromus occidentalis]|uniref:NPC intracellular cholesterol transporter 1 n=1 Tax=Galendromus occidentalis TaxID=34638 RepID=A0AAJ6QKU6_9ACAR|nr:NPC intracellular cholesterol transporter 1 [Galendromus occidentalis]